MRAYPVERGRRGLQGRDGLPIVEASKDNWFRPVDVAVAPDGSLFVADWYDPGVGGHNMSDQSQGRIFRIAPPGTRYTVPKLDLSSPAGAARALRSPNLATRQLAYERLASYGPRAETPLAAMWRGTVPHDRARALWLLARIPGRGARYLDSRRATPTRTSASPRCAPRAASVATSSRMAERLVRDPSPRCAAKWRSRCATTRARAPRRSGPASRSSTTDAIAGTSRRSASRRDRQWDRYFGAWLDRIGDEWNTPAGRDIVWRSRSARALPLLEKLASDQATPVADRLRYFRALDFFPAEARQKSLLALLGTPAGASAELTPVILSQLDAKTAGSVPEVQAALQRTLAASRGTSQYVELVDRYGVRTELDELVRLALARPNETVGAEAARLAISWGGMPRFAELVRGSDDMAARRALAVLGRNFTPAADTIMTAVLVEATRRSICAGGPCSRWAADRRGNAPARARARRPSRGRAQARGEWRALLGAAEHPRLGGAVSHSARRDDARRQDAPAAHDARRPHGRRRRRPPRVRARLRDVSRRRGHGHRLRTGAHRDRRQAAQERAPSRDPRPERRHQLRLRGLDHQDARRPAAHRHDRERDGRRSGDAADRRDPAPRAEEHDRRAEAHGHVAHAAGPGARR